MWLLVSLCWVAGLALNYTLHTLSCSKATCAQATRSCGLQVSTTQVRIRLTVFNRILNGIPPLVARVLRWWFSAGAVLGVILLVVSPVFVSATLLGFSFADSSLYTTWAGDSAALNTNQTQDSLSSFTPEIFIPAPVGAPEQARVLNPLIPGVTIPFFHLLYLFLVLLLASIVHELGHAFAAAADGVKVEAMGGFLMLIYPGAFVELHSGLLAIIRPWQQLRVFCAGIWHNTVLALLAFALLAVLPTLLSPLYTTGTGVAIAGVGPASVLHALVHAGDVLTRLDATCTVSRIADLARCIERLEADYTAGATGLCMDRATVAHRNTATAVWIFNGVIQCCGTPGEQLSSGDIARLCLVRRLGPDANLTLDNVACLAARRTLTRVEARCTHDSDCPADHHCYELAEETESNRLVRLWLRNHGEVLIMGPPRALFDDFTLSDYVPLGPAGVGLPVHLTLTLRYLSSVSAALAVLNILPAFCLDGQHAVSALLELLLPLEYFTSVIRRRIGLAVLWANTLLLVALLLSALLSAFA